MIMIPIVALFSLLIISCSSSDSDNGGGSSTAGTISGTAAVGMAIAGETVTSRDRNNNENTTTTGPDGGFSVAVDCSASPYVIKVENGGEVLYSFADACNVVSNITTMTNLALQEASKNGVIYVDLDDVYANFSSIFSEITQQDINDAIAKVNAHLASLLSSEGLPNVYDFFSTAFDADGTGIDAVLDGITITIDETSPGVITIDINGSTVSFDPNIDVTGFELGGGALTGDWTLTISGTAQGIPISNIVINGLPAAGVPTGSDPGEISQIINDSFGSLGTISNASFLIDSESDTQVVVLFTFTLTIPETVFEGIPIPSQIINYDLILTYTKE